MASPAVLLLALLSLPAQTQPPPSDAKPGEAKPADARAAGQGQAPEPAQKTQGTVVTATRLPRPVRDVPFTVYVLPREELLRSPSSTADLLVRVLPSVATFRRSSSLTADPSSQGLNLRGLGPSGVSRALVLVDGVPANDPFGGWVYWRALPRLGLGRVEVAPGGGSSLYGSAALGGVVQLVSRPLTPWTWDGEVQAGLLGTGGVAARGSHAWDGGGAALEAEALTTDGYVPVAPDQRGAVDGRASSRHVTVEARGELAPLPALRLSARAGFFGEDQNGGTRYTTARVRAGTLALGAAWDAGGAGTLDARLFYRPETFGQQRARVTPDRSSEALAGEQTVPAHEEGVSLVYTPRPLALGGAHQLLAGVDARAVAGHSDETLYAPAGTTSRRVAGGAQRFLGLWVQDAWEPSPALALLAGVRWDGWRNQDASLGEERAGGTRDEAFPDRSETQLSPRAGVRVRALEWLTVRAAASRAFRAPTLNELYRPFQVGTVLTAANPALTAERLWGTELGLEALFAGAWTARLTGFWNRLESPVTNATLPSPLPGGATRQRQNLGAARVQGLEASVDARPWRAWVLGAGYTLADARVTEAPDLPERVGKRLPQAPLHRATVSVAFDDPRLFTATLQLRVSGRAYEDDLNTLELPGYAVLDAQVSRRLGSGLELFAAAENTLDREYLVGRAGVDTVGPPLLVRVGLRLHAAR